MYFIVEAVAKTYGVAVPILLGRSQGRAVVKARQVAAYLGRRAGASYAWIGRAMRRHHTTALHGSRRVELRLEGATDRERETIERAWEMAQSMRDKRMAASRPGDVG